MYKKFKVAVAIVFLTMISFTSFSQSTSDVKEGKFSVPSYDEKYGGWKNMDKNGIDGQCTYKYSDGKEGTLFYSKDCSKYYVESSMVKWYYKDKETAIKALYGYKKYDVLMRNNVNCN